MLHLQPDALHVHLHAATYMSAATACSTNTYTILLQELVVDLLPSPQRCLDLIHELLPQLAFEVYRAFIQQVSHQLAAPSLNCTNIASALHQVYEHYPCVHAYMPMVLLSGTGRQLSVIAQLDWQTRLMGNSFNVTVHKVMHVMCMQVHDATSKLTAIPSSPEDFAELLGFLQKLEERRHGLDETYDHVGFPVADCSSFALLLDLMSTQSLISTTKVGTEIVTLETLCLMTVNRLLDLDTT